MNMERLWIPENEDGSGWADVDWPSVAQGSRYHYQHGLELVAARALRPAYYKVVTRIESATIEPHDNAYYVAADHLADFVAEFIWNNGAEIVWHIEPCAEPPIEAKVSVPSV